MRTEVRMRFEEFSFGSIRIDGSTYRQDVVVDRGHAAVQWRVNADVNDDGA